jgi:SAM-dependent methyltransferase
MGRILAAMYDRWMRGSEEACLRTWRATLLGGLAGEVLELGAGTGANLPHYGEGVVRLALVEPDRHMRAHLERRVAAERARLPSRAIDVSPSAAESLTFTDASFDAVVTTLVLCTTRDPAAALAEARRVLRPGGRLVVIEHVAAEDDPGRLAWQRRVEPLWRRIAGGCHVTRRTEAAIRAAGFTVERIERESVRGALPWVRPSIRGIARVA